VAAVIACDLKATTKALTAADAAYGSGDALTANQNVAQASGLLVELLTIVNDARTGQTPTATVASGSCLNVGG
jgi:hypothetical protein